MTIPDRPEPPKGGDGTGHKWSLYWSELAEYEHEVAFVLFNMAQHTILFPEDARHEASTVISAVLKSGWIAS